MQNAGDDEYSIDLNFNSQPAVLDLVSNGKKARAAVAAGAFAPAPTSFDLASKR